MDSVLLNNLIIDTNFVLRHLNEQIYYSDVRDSANDENFLILKAQIHLNEVLIILNQIKKNESEKSKNNSADCTKRK